MTDSWAQRQRQNNIIGLKALTLSQDQFETVTLFGLKFSLRELLITLGFITNDWNLGVRRYLKLNEVNP